jgi:hypothetical protein
MKKNKDVNITVDFTVTQKAYNGQLQNTYYNKWDTIIFEYKFETQAWVLKEASTNQKIRQLIKDKVVERIDELIDTSVIR